MKRLNDSDRVVIKVNVFYSLFISSKNNFLHFLKLLCVFGPVEFVDNAVTVGDVSSKIRPPASSTDNDLFFLESFAVSDIHPQAESCRAKGAQRADGVGVSTRRPFIR